MEKDETSEEEKARYAQLIGVNKCPLPLGGSLEIDGGGATSGDAAAPPQQPKRALHYWLESFKRASIAKEESER